MSSGVQPLSFRLCTLADKPALVAFMDAHWGSKHPLMHCDDFFSYYYESEPRRAVADANFDAGSNAEAAGKADAGPSTDFDAHSATVDTTAAQPLQFAVAEEDGAIVALAGYIWTAQTAPRDIWVSIWCAVKGKNGAGLELMAALPSLTGARVMACNNIRPKTMAFYTFLGYTAARLPHFYRLADKPAYTVARVAEKHILPAQGDAVLTRLADKALVLQRFSPAPALRPHKDAWYAARRYFDFPRQQYDVYAVSDTPWTPDSPLTALLVTRTVPVNGTAVLRIVDYLGAPERFAALGAALDERMAQVGAEYAECYCYGISPEIFAAAGFCERLQDDANVIPNYLTPPLYENTEYYFFTSDAAHFTMFKADGDQDRPNIVV